MWKYNNLKDLYNSTNKDRKALLKNCEVLTKQLKIVLDSVNPKPV